MSIIFFIGAVAETNRAPFDLAEAESELVSGLMTEHSAGIFVFFFLAEYASIILMCILLSIVFFGGYDSSCFVYIYYNLFLIMDYLIKFIISFYIDIYNYLFDSNKLFMENIYNITLMSKGRFLYYFLPFYSNIFIM